MQATKTIISIAALGVAGFTVWTLGCSGGEKKAPPSEAQPQAEAPKPAAPAEQPMQEAAAEPAGEPGNIKVKVAFEGTAPKREPINRQQDPFCAKTKMLDETVIVNPNNTLQNVVVRLTKGVRGKFDAPTTPITIDQHDCMYRPRVQVAQVGQNIQIKNSDKTLHNVHTYKGENQETWFNNAQTPNAQPIEKTFTDGGGMVKFKCDVHPWMSGYVVVGDHPFAGVTGAEGEVMLTNVPAKKYTLEGWHEQLGKTETEVTVEPGKTVEVTLTYKAGQAS